MKKTVLASIFVAMCLLIFTCIAVIEIHKKGSILKTVESKKVEASAYPPISELLLLNASTKHKS